MTDNLVGTVIAPELITTFPWTEIDSIAMEETFASVIGGYPTRFIMNWCIFAIKVTSAIILTSSNLFTLCQPKFAYATIVFSGLAFICTF